MEEKIMNKMILSLLIVFIIGISISTVSAVDEIIH